MPAPDGQEKHNDLIDLIIQSATKTVNVKGEDGTIFQEQQMDSDSLWWKTHSISANTLVEAGERELMEEVEIMLREELRGMIKEGASVSDVNSQIDAILIKMTTVEHVVPEFGSIAMLILVTAIIGLVLFARKTNLVFPRI